MHVDANYIKATIRTVPDWPEKGVMFRDITPLFQNPLALRGTLDAFIQRYLDKKVDVVAGIDARGFLLGVTIAYHLNLPFIPIRKKGKLPFKTVSEDYELEYGSASIEVNEDAVKEGDRVVIIDDLVATGGTMIAAINLIKKLGGNVIEAAAIIDLPELKGSKKISDAGVPVYTIMEFAGL